MENTPTPEPTVEEPVTSAFITGAPWPWADTVDITRPGFWWLPQQDVQMLLLIQPDVTEQMCTDLTGPADVSITGYGPMIGLMARFNGPDPRHPGGWAQWAESVMWRFPGHFPENLLPENVPDHGHLSFLVHLVDSTTGILRHQRFFTTSPHFTKTLVREANDRWKPGITAEQAEAALEDWYRRFPTPNSVLKAAVARSHSGD